MIGVVFNLIKIKVRLIFVFFFVFCVNIRWMRELSMDRDGHLGGEKSLSYGLIDARAMFNRCVKTLSKVIKGVGWLSGNWYLPLILKIYLNDSKYIRILMITRNVKTCDVQDCCMTTTRTSDRWDCIGLVENSNQWGGAGEAQLPLYRALFESV